VVIGKALVFYEVGLMAGGGRRVERVEGAHGGEAVTWMEWAPAPQRLEDGTEVDVLATAGADRKVKLWRAP